ncbi:MAG: hypothetical protein IH987_16080 [Planctomycetes bacterium]|nr:hypothetical protein [Planctomycetota bacterium]
MLFRKCMVAAALSVGIVTASFALVASDDLAGVTEPACSVVVESPADDPPPLDNHEQSSGCPGMTDCNGNGVDDRCDVDCSNSGIFCIDGFPANAMCNSGYHASCGTSADCNENGVPDECEGVECCSDFDCGLGQCCGHQTANVCGWCSR